MRDPASPYAPPKASLAVVREAPGALSRDGKVLVMAPNAAFPRRCVKCNDAVDAAPHPCKLAWVHPGFYGLYALAAAAQIFPPLILAPLIAPLVIALARRKADIEIRLCNRHFRRIAAADALLKGGGALLIPSCVYAFASMLDAPLPHPMPPGAAILVFAGVFPWAIAIALLRRTVSAARISEGIIRVRGCGARFLDSLPAYPGATTPTAARGKAG